MQHFKSTYRVTLWISPWSRCSLLQCWNLNTIFIWVLTWPSVSGIRNWMIRTAFITARPWISRLAVLLHWNFFVFLMELIISVAAIFNRTVNVRVVILQSVLCREYPGHKGIRVILRIIGVEILSSRTFIFVCILEIFRVWDVIAVPVAELWNMCRLLQMPIT